MTKALGGEASWNMRNVAVDAFGSALGNSIVKSMKTTSTTEKVSKQVQEIKSSSMSPEQQQKAIQKVFEEQGVVYGAADNGGGSSGGGSGGSDGGGAEDMTKKAYIAGSFDDKGNMTLKRMYGSEVQGEMTANFSQLDSSDYTNLSRVHGSILDFAGGLLSTNTGLMDISADLYTQRFNTQSALQQISSQYAYEEGVNRGFHNARIGRQQSINYIKGQGFTADYMSQAEWAQAMARPDSFVSDMSGFEKFLMRTGTAFVQGITGTFEGLAAVTGLKGKEAFVDSWTGIGNFIANPIDSTVSAVKGAYNHFKNVYQTEGLGAALGEGFGMFLSGVPTAMLGGPVAGRLGGIAGNWASRGAGAAARGLDNLAQKTLGFGMKEAYLATSITINSLDLDSVLSPALMTSATVLERLARTGIGCFVAGTLVHTSNGLKAIEDIRVGDMVLSQPEVTGDVEYKPVANTFIFHDKNVFDVEITTKDGRVDVQRVTDNHPYWVDGIGWTRVDFLEVGQEVELADKSLARITKLIQLEETERVYNFEVDEYHTYYVGEIGVWVHNTRECGAEVSLERANKFSGLPNNVAEPLNLIRYEMSNALRGPVSGSRQVGIDRAWALETELIMKTGRGTTPWTLEQIDLIKNGAGYRDLGFTGHHLNRVKDAPQWKADPRNIIFLRQGSGMSHMRLGHPGGTRAVQPPKLLIDREAMLGSLDGGLITAPYVGPDITHYLPLD